MTRSKEYSARDASEGMNQDAGHAPRDAHTDTSAKP